MTTHRIETSLVHAGEPRPRIGRAIQTPIYQCTVFEQLEGGGYDDISYPRLNNLPNHQVVGAKMARVEGGEAGLVLASGMAAITTTLLAELGAGGHLLAQSGLYGGTHGFLAHTLGDLGGAVDFLDADPAMWKRQIRPATRAIYVEAITNPLCQVIDHRAVVAFAREHGIAAIIDNTFATPINFRPLSIGYDVAVHSATKYLNGHSDLVAGVVVGSTERVERVRKLANHLGGCLEPFGLFLLARGLKTLALRVRHQNASALAVARHLAGRPQVERVHYPGLETHPDHRRARELFAGFGGMLSFELAGGAAAATRLLAAVKLATHAPSLGGPETLVVRPAATSHAGLSPQERQRLGIADGLVRMSIGLEAIEDIVADLDAAL